MQIRKIIQIIEKNSSPRLQESYDNTGLLTGNPDQESSEALLCVDISEEVINEAIKLKINFIISHHPFIFGGIKKVNGKNETERILIKAIKNDIAIYALHTSYDQTIPGISYALAKHLGLTDIRILDPRPDNLKKLVSFVPLKSAEKVREAILTAGAGHIGNYDFCSFQTEGTGTFRALDGSHPYVGKKGNIHHEPELRIETIVPEFLLKNVIEALLQAHPYEEVAYDIYPLENLNKQIGFGAIGKLSKETKEIEFLTFVKEKLQCKSIRHSKLLNKKISKVAVCGGSGIFLLQKAIAQKADVFITADIKYHQFQEPDNKIVIVDIGHYESEKIFLPSLKEYLNKNLTNFAVRISKMNTNPVNYL
ncbi:MAG: Nif3-like dinuclear metal center hexameric protein [Bacteroidetes bacterium HGW-Bacteroidetes-21]|jgi:dinuclear metal center YbgI/SA1388 family protein|nr:MAG: Nif3-like dinuclear metal center hexameric protein [Bacteroidetes bacterium HGW-Bacteroidetes-21]